MGGLAFVLLGEGEEAGGVGLELFQESLGFGDALLELREIVVKVADLIIQPIILVLKPKYPILKRPSRRFNPLKIPLQLPNLPPHRLIIHLQIPHLIHQLPLLPPQYFHLPHQPPPLFLQFLTIRQQAICVRFESLYFDVSLVELSSEGVAVCVEVAEFEVALAQGGS